MNGSIRDRQRLRQLIFYLIAAAAFTLFTAYLIISHEKQPPRNHACGTDSGIIEDCL